MMKILVATDGSRAGVAAVKFASNLAADHGRNELIVLTVYASAATTAPGTNGSGPRKEAQKVLGEAAREIRRRGSPPARFELVRARGADGVPEAISRQADRLRADMVVVGSEGRDSLTEWVVGGTALRLIYVARRPVTVVRAPRSRPSRRQGVR
jgi:nucleotide-binding universal stress UspA family protein